MSVKRSSSLSLSNQHKRRKSDADKFSNTYFHRTMLECGLLLKAPPQKCIASNETVYLVRNLNKTLRTDDDYPQNVEKFLKDFENACKDKKLFEHYLFMNIDQMGKDSPTPHPINDSVLKILLNVTFLQNKLIEYVFDTLIDLFQQPDIEMLVKTVLKTLSEVNVIENSENLSIKLIDLLDVSSSRTVKLDIISAIPDIIGDQEHDSVASKLCGILSSDDYLIPSILDCLTYLCISDAQFAILQVETLKMFNPSNMVYFPNFVKFLLTQGKLDDKGFEQTIQGLRQELAWSTLATSQQELATSQVLTATTIRNCMLSSKPLAKAWLNVLSNCKTDTDHKPIDVIFFLILYTICDEKQKQVETIMKKHIKFQILKEDLLDKVFKNFKPVLKEYLIHLISLSNTFLKSSSEPFVQKFASHMYMVMFSELTECCPTIVSELLQLVLSNKQSILSTLNILNDVATKNMSLLNPQSLQMLTLLDRMDDMSLKEIKAVMNLVCGLAFGVKNSAIRNDIDIIIAKELGSSVPSIKLQGIIAGIYAVKYLSKGGNDDEDLSVTDSEGDLHEAGLIIQRIHNSTRHFPDMMAFFYDELYNVIEQATDMNKKFITWLANVVLNDLKDHFLVQTIERDTFDEIKVSMKLCLNTDSELDEPLAVNIAGLTLEENNDISIEILSPLFQLVRVLYYKMDDGDLSSMDALLGCAIVMPSVDIYTVRDMSDSAVAKILDCYVHCVNWIRELLNAFSSQLDEWLKPKIFHRIPQLRNLETAIEQILLEKNINYKPPNYSNYFKEPERFRKPQGAKQKKGKKSDKDDTIPGSGKSQQTQSVKNKLETICNIHFRPLNLSLFELLRHDLKLHDAQDRELTVEILAYLLNHLNSSFEKILVSKIKRKTFLNKDLLELYNRSDAEAQAKLIYKMLPKIKDHMDVITSFLDKNDIDGELNELDSLFVTKLMESCQCMEYIYRLLTIYFRWIEFKNDQVQLLNDSLNIIVEVPIPDKDLITTAIEKFQKNEKYSITLSSAVSLMELMKAFQELSTGPSVKLTLREMAHKFLSKQWKTQYGDVEKGLIYNRFIDSLIKVYLSNSDLVDIKGIVTSLVNDVGVLREKTSILDTFKCINKSNFSLLFRNLAIALCEKIKPNLSKGLTNEEHVEMWRTVANILRMMSDIVMAVGNKNTSAAFLKKSIPTLNLFLTKGFPILKLEFQNLRQVVLDSLKDFHSTNECLNMICSQSTDGALMKKIPVMKGLLTDFNYKTKDLLKSNDCLEAIEMFNVSDLRYSKRSTRKDSSNICQDTTVEDCDDHFSEDDSDASNDLVIDSVGVSDLI